ncbi:MAG: NUDIX domain-containing protein [Lentisphaeria bacterium]|jgi:isopentenyldiphosphate isomerase|nr:NUDIX domain-containing protein [Lentisphaeria bacterium]
MSDEWFDIVDGDDRVIGRALRSECHGNPALVHRTAHVVVFHPDGRLLLQKRSPRKDIQPGRWDTAVGGHLLPGEAYEAGARREMAEELGLPPDLPLRFLFEQRIRNAVESENVHVFTVTHPGPFAFDRDEIDEVRFWTPCELREGVATDGLFTPNLCEELARLMPTTEYGGEGIPPWLTP